MAALMIVIKVAAIWAMLIVVVVLFMNVLLSIGRGVSSFALRRRLDAMEAGTAEPRFEEIPYDGEGRRIFLYTGWSNCPELFRLELGYFLTVRDLRLLGVGPGSAGIIISVEDPPEDDPKITVLEKWRARKRHEGKSISQ